jgi:hypothetical protein
MARSKKPKLPPPTSADALTKLVPLEALWDAHGTGLPETAYRFTSALPPDRLLTAEEVWQPRLPNGGGDTVEGWRINEHVKDLEHLIDKPGSKPLDPITVLPIAVGVRVDFDVPVEPGWYVVEGHLRLAAYRRVKWVRPVPVKVFRGSFRESLLHSCEANSLRKLSLTPKERREAGWRHACFRSSLPVGHPERPSLRRLAAVTGLSYGVIQSMAKVADEGLPGHPEVNPRALSWAVIERIRKGGTQVEVDEDALVQRMEVQLRRQFGTRNPRLVGLALRRVFSAGDLRQLLSAAGVNPFHLPTTKERHAKIS